VTRNSKVLRRSVLALCFAVLASPGQAQRPTADSLRVVFFDVGQGDAALITTPEGKHILIDAGPGRTSLTAQLDSLGVQTLDLVISSHNHADHIGGMADVFAKYRVLQYMDNGVPALTAVYRRTVDAVDAEKGLQFRRAEPRVFRFGPVSVAIMAPRHVDLSQNDNSVGIVVKYGSFSGVLTGDAERSELEYWLAAYQLGKVSLVKASHHGSWNGTTAAWVSMLRPQLLVVSVGASNQYGHPDARVVEAYQSMGARVYRTDSVGTVTVRVSADGGFNVRTTSGLLPWDWK